MAMKRGRPGNPKVRSGKSVGPDYPETKWENPFNAGVDEEYEPNNDARTLRSPTATTVGGADLSISESDPYED